MVLSSRWTPEERLDVMARIIEQAKDEAIRRKIVPSPEKVAHLMNTLHLVATRSPELLEGNREQIQRLAGL